MDGSDRRADGLRHNWQHCRRHDPWRPARIGKIALSRKRLGSTGLFAGVTTISISPDYFVNYYSQLPRPGIFALYRADGAILARYPEPPPQFTRLPADGLFMNAMRAGSWRFKVPTRCSSSTSMRAR